MKNNTSDGTGGAIWGGNRATYNFNGGIVANNSATAGGAMWTGTYETINVNGTVFVNNKATELGGAFRLCDHTTLNIKDGSVDDNYVNNEESNIFANNNNMSITGGTVGVMSYAGGLGLTVGDANVECITYDLGTNHNTAYLAADFNSFKFKVNEESSKFSNFNFKPAADYTYTAGDEAKLICLNEGYSTYWDANTSTFRLQAN